MTHTELKKSQAHFENAYQACLKNAVPVTAPLVLISQIQRSGGSMLSQLFDGHPEVHAHPHELKIGYPKKYNWPHIDLDDHPARWFEILFEEIVDRHFRFGYKKMEKYTETSLFIFSISLQKDIFLDYLNSLNKVTIRDVFDAYMTSYFGAWINNQNIRGPKQVVSAFTPRLAMLKNNMKSYFDVYPDGRLISVIRDPKNWFPSATRHLSDKYGDIRQALEQWCDSTEAMVSNKEKYGDRVCLIRFKDLISRTESAMQVLADFLGIRFEDILLIPTFNKIPINPNTSFKLEKADIMASALTRYKTLDQKELAIIAEMTAEIYENAKGLVARIP